MIKIVFICHGNICRSAAAEYIMKDMLRKSGRQQEFVVASAGTSAEEFGNPMYPPMYSQLKKHGIDGRGHVARRMKIQDYEDYDYLIGMDEENRRNMYRMWPDDPQNKIHLLLDFTDAPMEVSDPWYTRDFRQAYNDIQEGCKGLYEYLMQHNDSADFSGNKYILDLRNVFDKNGLHMVIRHTLPVQEYYGNNLDALHDYLTELSDNTDILVLYSNNTEQNLGKYFYSFKKMTKAAVQHNPMLNIHYEKQNTF